ncbi:MAG: hypothetical protein ACM31F_08790 [Gemmatimonas sp.]
MLNERRTLRDGIVVGLIGYASVALFYSAFDILASRGMFYTVNLLGKALFRGLRDPAVLMFPLEIDFTAAFLYNLVHLAAALIIGVVVTVLVVIAEQHPSRRGVVRIILVAGFFVTVALVATLTTPIRPLLPMWSVVASNALAAIIAGAYLLSRRPGLWSKLALAN